MDTSVLGNNRPISVKATKSGREILDIGYIYGSIPGEQLIVGGMKQIEFSVGDELSIWISADEEVVSFWATVLEIFRGSQTIYFLSFPKGLLKTPDKRKFLRMSVFIPAEVRISQESDGQQQHHNFEGALIDISQEGCHLSTNLSVGESATCSISFILPGTDQRYLLEGKVMRHTHQGSNFLHGIQFSNVPQYHSIIGDIRSWISRNIPLAT